jgi:hypothetical protein
MFKIDYYIFKYFLTSKMAVLTKICLMVIYLYTAYFKRRITSSASDSHTVLHTLWKYTDIHTYRQGVPSQFVKNNFEKSIKIQAIFAFTAMPVE